MDDITPDGERLTQTTLPLQDRLTWVFWLCVCGSALLSLSVFLGCVLNLWLDGPHPAWSQALRESMSPLAFSQVLIRFALCFAFGGFLLWRRPRDRMALLTAMTFFPMGALAASNIMLTASPSLQPMMPLWRALAAVNVTLGLCSMIAMVLLFPRARFAPPWTRWLLPFLFAGPVLHVATFWHQQVFPVSTMRVITVVVLISLTFLTHRFYTTTHYREKQQLKWVGLGLGWALVLQGFIAPWFNPNHGQLDWLRVLLFYTTVTLSYIVVFMAFILSLLRYRLWDIDIVVNRSLVYGGLFLGLLALFGGGFWGLQIIFTNILGSQQQVVSAATAMAIVAGAFQPCLRWLRRTVDQKIFGVAIDYRALAQDAPPQAVSGQTPSTPSQEELFGDYIKRRKIGVGGMGEVHLAEHKETGQRIALKRLLPERSEKEELRKRFLREAEILAQLQHPNIISVLDYGIQGDELYMAMEYIEGVDLDEEFESNGPFAPDELRHLLVDVAKALDYAHQQGVVHRDIKPSNVMLLRHSKDAPEMAERLSKQSTLEHLPTPQEQRLASYPMAMLMDFGIARSNTVHTQLTHDNKFLGTPQYIAPEQIQGAHLVDGRADIYALGVMVYLLTTGRLPFEHDQLFSLMMAHLSQPPPNPRNYNHSLPAHTATAILKALQKNPKARFSTASEFVQALYES